MPHVELHQSLSYVYRLDSGQGQPDQSGPNQQLSELGCAHLVAYSWHLKITTYDHVVSAQTINRPLLNLSLPVDDHLLNASSSKWGSNLPHLLNSTYSGGSPWILSSHKELSVQIYYFVILVWPV